MYYSQDLLVDALKQQFLEYPRGFVVENLKSIFLPNQITALKSILTAIGNTKFVHCIVLYNSYLDYSSIKKIQHEQELTRLQDIKMAKLEHFDEITPEELDALSEEDKLLYKEIYIARRKEATAQRLAKLK